MANRSDIPDPGEDATPDELQAETSPGPVPDGATPDRIPVPDRRRLTHEMAPVNLAVAGDASEGREDERHRTSTDGDGLASVRVSDGPATEHRLDRSAADDHREPVFDPAHDDAGPQSDQV